MPALPIGSADAEGSIEEDAEGSFEEEDNDDIVDGVNPFAEFQRIFEEVDYARRLRMSRSVEFRDEAESGSTSETIQPALGSAEAPICLDCSVEEDAAGSIKEDAEGSIEEHADGLTGQEPVPCHSRSLARRSRRRGVNHRYARPITRVTGQQRKPILALKRIDS